MNVADQLVAVHLHARVVAPLLRVSDLVADHRQLFFRSLLGVVAHPRQSLDVVAQRLLQRRHQLVHARLGLGRKVLLHPVLAHCLAKFPVGQGRTLLPARLRLFLSIQSPCKEGEIFVEKRLRQARCLSVQNVPAKIALPRLQRLALQQPVQRLEVIRSRHVQTIEVANPDAREVHVPIEVRSQLLKVANRVNVIPVRWVAQIRAAGRGLRHRRLNLHHCRGLFRCLLRPIAGQREHLGHVRYVLRADAFETRRIHNVVVAVGQRNSALEDLRDLFR